MQELQVFWQLSGEQVITDIISKDSGMLGKRNLGSEKHIENQCYVNKPDKNMLIYVY